MYHDYYYDGLVPTFTTLTFLMRVNQFITHHEYSICLHKASYFT